MTTDICETNSIKRFNLTIIIINEKKIIYMLLYCFVFFPVNHNQPEPKLYIVIQINIEKYLNFSYYRKTKIIYVIFY